MKLRHAVAVLLVLALCCGLADGKFGKKGKKDKNKNKPPKDNGDKDTDTGNTQGGSSWRTKLQGIGTAVGPKALGALAPLALNFITGDKDDDPNAGNDDEGTRPEKILDGADWEDGGKEATTIKDTGLSTAAIIGIVVGCCVCVMAMTIGIVLLMKNKNKAEDSERGRREDSESPPRRSRGSRQHSKGSRSRDRKDSRRESGRRSRDVSRDRYRDSERSSMDDSEAEADQSYVDSHRERKASKKRESRSRSTSGYESSTRRSNY